MYRQFRTAFSYTQNLALTHETFYTERRNSLRNPLKPYKTVKHLTEGQKEIIRNKLLAKKNELMEELGRIAKKDEGSKDNWKATYENIGDELDDNAQEVAEHDVAVSLEHSLELHLKRVREALERFEGGTFGLCEIDGKPIAPERLLVTPETTRCHNHS